MYKNRYANLDRRSAVLDALTKQAITPRQNQMVSGRVVPMGIGEGLTQLAQAYMAKQGQDDITKEREGIDAEKAAGTKKAIADVMTQMQGTPESYNMAGLESPEVKADPVGAMAQAATDPHLQDNKAVQALMLQQLKNQKPVSLGRGNRPLSSSEGFLDRTKNGWETIKKADGTPYLPVTADAANRAKIAGQTTDAQLIAKLKREDKLKAKIKDAEMQVQINRDKPKETLRKDTIKNNLGTLRTALEELRDHKGLSGITGAVFGRTPSVAEDSINAQAKLESVQSKIFISALQSMREASKTGGAVGNVSDAEGKKLQNSMAALSRVQGTPQYRKEVNKIIDQIDKSLKVIDTAYSSVYPTGKPESSSNVMKFDAQGNLI